MKKLFIIIVICSFFGISLYSLAFDQSKVDKMVTEMYSISNPVDRLKTIRATMYEIKDFKMRISFMRNIISYAIKLNREAINKKEYPNIKLESFSYIYSIDGDTIKIRNNAGKITSLRLIGIDTPESNETRYGYKECYGEEAKKYLKNLIGSAKYVSIEFDDSQGKTDKYGRLLGYLWFNGKNINEKIISEGYGFEYTFNNNPYKYQSEFISSESSAKLNVKGLWSNNTCKGLRTSVGKENDYSCGKKLYCTQMETCEEARYYFNTCGLYSLDADGDLMPCESLCAAG